jgi:hypothetical protein
MKLNRKIIMGFMGIFGLFLFSASIFIFLPPSTGGTNIMTTESEIDANPFDLPEVRSAATSLTSESYEYEYLSGTSDTEEFSYYISSSYTSYYHMAWIRASDDTDNFGLSVYSDSSFSTLSDSSTYIAGYTDAVIMKSSSYDTHYIEATSQAGSGYFYLEAERAATITPGASSTTVSLSTSERGELYQSYLSSGTTYTIYLDVSSGDDYDLYLYYISSSGTKGRNEYTQYSNTASGTDCSITYTPSSTGYYGIAVFQQAGSGNAYLSVNTGTGGSSTGSISSSSLTTGSYSSRTLDSYDEEHYSYYASSSYYNVVWTRPSSSSDSNYLYAYSSNTYSPAIETSSRTSGNVNAILFKPSTSAYYYFMEYARSYGTYYCGAERSEALSVGTSDSEYIGSTSPVYCYQISLESGITYSLELDNPSYSANNDIYLYKIDSGGTKSLTEQVAKSSQSGSGDDDTLQYTPGTSGTYVVLIVWESGSGTISFQVTQPIDFVTQVLPWILGVVGVIVVGVVLKVSKSGKVKGDAKKGLSRSRNLIMTEDYNGALQTLEPLLPKLRKAKMKEAGEVEAMIKNVKLHQGINSALTRYQQQARSGGVAEAVSGLQKLNQHAGKNRANLNPQLLQRVSQTLQQLTSTMDQSANVIRQTLGQVTQYMEAKDYDQAVQFLNGKKMEAQNAGLTDLAKDIDGRMQNITRFKKLFNLFKISSKVKLDDVQRILGMNREELLQSLMEWQNTLKGFKIDGDYLTLEDSGSLGGLMGVLDSQFDEWEEKEQSKEGKIEDFNMDDFEI